MRNSIIIAVGCATVIMAIDPSAMAVDPSDMDIDPTAVPIPMRAAASCFPTATACPGSLTHKNSTINFPKLPTPTGPVPKLPGPIPDLEDDDDDDDDDGDDDENDENDDDVSKKPGIPGAPGTPGTPGTPVTPGKVPVPPKIPGQQVMPNDHYFETVTISTVVCIPTVITSVIKHQKPGPTARPTDIPSPDRVYLPKPSASAFNPDKFSPRFTAAASVAKISSSLVFVVGALVYLSLA